MTKKYTPSKNRLRIATWNINSVRARLELVPRFLSEYAPDILCLQEIKASSSDFPMQLFRNHGYRHQAMNGQKMHHGVAIVSKVPLAAESRQDWQANGEARHIGVTLYNGFTAVGGGAGVRLENVYAPAGGEVPDFDTNPKFIQKLDYFDRMIAWATALATPTILVGDFNIAPLPTDVWSHKELKNVVSHTDIEIAKIDAMIAAHGWIDVARHIAPEPARLHSWWSYRAADWKASDRGRRLDHIWVSPVLKNHIVDCFVAEDVRGWDKPSDHAPVIADFLLDDAASTVKAA
jgi:exodeoxyribonuclease III